MKSKKQHESPGWDEKGKDGIIYLTEYLKIGFRKLGGKEEQMNINNSRNDLKAES